MEARLSKEVEKRMDVMKDERRRAARNKRNQAHGSSLDCHLPSNIHQHKPCRLNCPNKISPRLELSPSSIRLEPK